MQVLRGYTTNMLRLNNQPTRQQNSKAGFTLLEVMIAVAVLAITLTVLFGSQSQSLSLAAEAKFNTKATFLAAMKMAQLESGVAELQNDEGDFGEDYPDFNWKIEVEDTDFSDPEYLEDLNESLKRVTLTVQWQDSPFTYVVDYFIQEREGN